MLFVFSLSTISSHFCRCMTAFADVCMCEVTFTSLYYPLRSCVDVLLVPLESLLLAVNNTNRDFESSLRPSSHHSLIQRVFFIFLPHLLICSPSVSFRLYPFPVSVYCSPSIHPPVPPSLPFSSPRQMVSVSLGWLRNQRCNFFFSPSVAPSLSPQSNFSVFPLRSL